MSGQADEKSGQRAITILHIGDDPEDRRRIQGALTQAWEINAPFVLEQADRLTTGLGHLKTRQVDVVLLDLHLPDSQGLEALHTIQAHAPEVPVVVLAEPRDRPLAIQAIRQGAQDHLDKSHLIAPLLMRVIRYAVERRQLQSSLATTRKRLGTIEAIIQDVAEGILMVGEGNTIRFANPAAARMWGCPVEELVGQRLDIPIQNGHGTEIELMRRDGTTTTIEAIATAIEWEGESSYLIQLHDISHRKQASKRIQRQVAITRTLVRTAERLNAQLDLQEVLRSVCEEASRVTSVPIVTLYLYDPQRQVWHCAGGHGLPAGWETMCQPIQNQLYEALAHEAGSVIIIPDVQAIPDLPHADLIAQLNLRTLVSIIMKRDRQPVGALNLTTVGKVRQFTADELALLEGLASQAAQAIANSQLYATLKQIHEQLKEALRAQEEMIQNVSHELRTPLTLIRGYAEMLKEEMLGPLSPEQKNAVEIAFRNSERLHFMIERLLVLQTINSRICRKTRLSPTTWLEKAVANWRKRGRAINIHLSLKIAPNLPAIQGDIRLLNQVIDNLLDNAAKFSPNGGQVRICARRDRKNIVITVSDEGVGIPADKLERIFQPFFQVDGSSTRTFSGMGIGLALCKRIVERHGGRIWATSEGKNQGSTFHITLPVAEPAYAPTQLVHPRELSTDDAVRNGGLWYDGT